MWLYSFPLRRQAAHTLIRTVPPPPPPHPLHTAVLHQAPLQHTHSSLPFTYLGAHRQRSCRFYSLPWLKVRKCTSSPDKLALFLFVFLLILVCPLGFYRWVSRHSRFPCKTGDARAFFPILTPSTLILLKRASNEPGSLQNDSCSTDGKYKNLCVNTNSFKGIASTQRHNYVLYCLWGAECKSSVIASPTQTKEEY